MIIYYDSSLQADHRQCLGFDHTIEKYGEIDAKSWKKKLPVFGRITILKNLSHIKTTRSWFCQKLVTNFKHKLLYIFQWDGQNQDIPYDQLEEESHNIWSNLAIVIYMSVNLSVYFLYSRAYKYNLVKIYMLLINWRIYRHIANLEKKRDIYNDSPLQADHRECLGFDHPIKKYRVIDA